MEVSKNTAQAISGVTKHVRVMISSRCNDPVPGSPTRVMTELRREIKKRLVEAELLGWKPFEVMINEDEPPLEGDRDAFEHCIEEAARSDIVLGIVNGNAGWSAEPGGIGICHAELKRAHDVAPARLRIIRLPDARPANDADRLFREWLDGLGLWTGSVSSFDEALERSCVAVTDALATLAREGGREGRRGRFHTGDALAWSRLSYEQRGERMQAAARDGALAHPRTRLSDAGVVRRFARHDVLLRIHAVPGPMSEPSARALVGQPFLRDHEVAAALADLAGPVHVVACHRGVTETQAARILGFPDATLVTTPFGVWIADPVQKAQLLFLAQCRDETATRIAVQRAFEWLDSSGEGELLAARAKSRARIVTAIAEEANDQGGGSPAPGGRRGGTRRAPRIRQKAR